MSFIFEKLALLPYLNKCFTRCFKPFLVHSSAKNSFRSTRNVVFFYSAFWSTGQREGLWYWSPSPFGYTTGYKLGFCLPIHTNITYSYACMRLIFCSSSVGLSYSYQYKRDQTVDIWSQWENVLSWFFFQPQYSYTQNFKLRTTKEQFDSITSINLTYQNVFRNAFTDYTVEYIGLNVYN